MSRGSASGRPGILAGVALDIRDLVLPPSQRRSLEELSGDLDLRSGDRSAKLSAFWTMLVLAAVIATAGILGDSTATVIGAMIIAPLSTPIMGIALGIVTRERNRAVLFVALGAVIVVLIGYLVALLVPGGTDVAHNSQIAARTSPKLLDLGAAIATGLAGAVALARRDVAAVVPGVAIAISLVPPLAVVGSAWPTVNGCWRSVPCCCSSATWSRWSSRARCFSRRWAMRSRPTASQGCGPARDGGPRSR